MISFFKNGMIAFVMAELVYAIMQTLRLGTDALQNGVAVIVGVVFFACGFMLDWLEQE